MKYLLFYVILFNSAACGRGNIVLDGVQDRIIENQTFDGVNVDNIAMNNCSNITIRNCIFKNSSELAIFAYKSSNILIEQCYFENVKSAFYAIACSGPIVVQNNECKNVQGPFPRGNFVQLNDCHGPGIRISYNYIINEYGKSNPEDIISSYMSSGEEQDYIEFANNYIHGHGSTTSGTSIILNDGGNPSRYIKAVGNVIVNSMGIGIAGGTNCIIQENKLFNEGTATSNVGIVVWNYYPLTGNCSDHIIARNQVMWVHKDGYENPVWIKTSRAPGDEQLPCIQVHEFGNDYHSKEVGKFMPAPDGCGITAWKGPLTNP